MAGRYNMTIEQGATFALSMVWKDDAGTTINIQGATAKMQIRKTADNSVALELSTENGRITIGVDNTINLAITAADTGSLSVENCKYDLEITQGAVVTRLIQGMAVISPQVTT